MRNHEYPIAGCGVSNALDAPGGHDDNDAVDEPLASHHRRHQAETHNVIGRHTHPSTPVVGRSLPASSGNPTLCPAPSLCSAVPGCRAPLAALRASTSPRTTERRIARAAVTSTWESRAAVDRRVAPRWRFATARPRHFYYGRPPRTLRTAHHESAVVMTSSNTKVARPGTSSHLPIITPRLRPTTMSTASQTQSGRLARPWRYQISRENPKLFTHRHNDAGYIAPCPPENWMIGAAGLGRARRTTRRATAPG